LMGTRIWNEEVPSLFKKIDCKSSMWLDLDWIGGSKEWGMSSL